jgi:hypothetical protein
MTAAALRRIGMLGMVYCGMAGVSPPSLLCPLTLVMGNRWEVWRETDWGSGGKR